jgi:hypothetical protein
VKIICNINVLCVYCRQAKEDSISADLLVATKDYTDRINKKRMQLASLPSSDTANRELLNSSIQLAEGEHALLNTKFVAARTTLNNEFNSQKTARENFDVEQSSKKVKTEETKALKRKADRLVQTEKSEQTALKRLQTKTTILPPIADITAGEIVDAVQPELVPSSGADVIAGNSNPASNNGEAAVAAAQDAAHNMLENLLASII